MLLFFFLSFFSFSLHLHLLFFSLFFFPFPSLPSGRVGTSQVCRPHFHSALQPWISEAAKPMVPHPLHHSPPTWCSPFAKQPSPAHHHPHASASSSAIGHPAAAGQSGHHSSHHLFSFPPTPPKDATPDTVTNSVSTSSSGNSSTSNVTNSSGVNSSNSLINASSVSNSVSANHLTGHDQAAMAIVPYGSSGDDGKGHPGHPGHHAHYSPAWGMSALSVASSNCGASSTSSGSNKPREGNIHNSTHSNNFHCSSSGALSQSPNHPYHHPTHYVPASSSSTNTSSSSPATIAGDSYQSLAAAAYGYHSTAAAAAAASSMLHNSMSMSKGSQSSQSSKTRTKGRSSAGKDLTENKPLLKLLPNFLKLTLTAAASTSTTNLLSWSLLSLLLILEPLGHLSPLTRQASGERGETERDTHLYIYTLTEWRDSERDRKKKARERSEIQDPGLSR